MENQLQTFEHEQFGKIRVVIIDGNPWFVPTDVCRALEIGNPSQALKHLDEDEKSSITLPKDGVTNTLISNEGNNDATCSWIENRVKSRVRKKGEVFMENQLQIFEHEQFGKIRAIVIDGKTWFVTVDICRILKLNDVRKAVSRLNDNEKCFVESNPPHKKIIPQKGDTKILSLVNEPGFYRLVFSSRQEKAVELQDWVYHEVLPSINATGSYSLPTTKTSPAHVPNPNRRAGRLKNAAVYSKGLGDCQASYERSKIYGKSTSNLRA